MKRVVIFLIRLYQRFLSPLLMSNCRFQPTCSQYTVEAVDRYGALKGLWLGAKRMAAAIRSTPAATTRCPSRHTR